jgi:hypothetical protein
MKVFISWSGNKSHRVAMVFRDWFPSVIQSIIPYVSSEDIDKGARWSTDIAKELDNSTFGILCVTRENMNAPWLSFEAGALSKTMDKSFVSPFLFDIKRSEVNGPILQFQSTIFQKEDIKKLVFTLNKACGQGNITDARLEKAFDVWFPTLEQQLNALRNINDEPEEAKKTESSRAQTSEILEEILDLARNNQKLLRNPELRPDEMVNDIKKLLMEVTIRNEKYFEAGTPRHPRRIHPGFVEEMLNRQGEGEDNYFGILLILSLLKNDFPWIYDLGKELVDIFKSKSSQEKKILAVREFESMIDLSVNHPLVKDNFNLRKDNIMLLKELPFILSRNFERKL